MIYELPNELTKNTLSDIEDKIENISEEEESSESSTNSLQENKEEEMFGNKDESSDSD